MFSGNVGLMDAIELDIGEILPIEVSNTKEIRRMVRTYCLPIASRGVKSVPKASKVKTRGLCLDI